MAEILTLGPVGLNPLGEFNSETQYERLDVVLYNGVSYVATQTVQGVLPTNTEYWDALGVSGADMTNYYTKSQTDDLISAISTMNLKVVQELPTEDISTTTIYLVPKTTTGANDAYDEYIYVSNNWEPIGSTQVDLTDYVKNTDYATTSKGGVVKISNILQLTIGPDGLFFPLVRTYNEYVNIFSNSFISKGTLENVLTNRIGAIDDVLDAINGESV